MSQSVSQSVSSTLSAAHSTIDSRYRFVRPLGQGGMGEVSCVFDRLTSTPVALKRVRLDATDVHSGGVIAPSTSIERLSTQHFPSNQPEQSDTVLGPRISVGSTEATNRLRMALAQEFHTLASLRHPHIISVLDYGFDSELRPYFTMEFISGARSLLEATRGLALPQKVELLCQLLSAISYLHRRGVLHRDLKPSNITTVEKRCVTSCHRVRKGGKSKRLCLPPEENHKHKLGDSPLVSREVFPGQGKSQKGGTSNRSQALLNQRICGGQ